jgi:hypothetical protein
MTLRRASAPSNDGALSDELLADLATLDVEAPPASSRAPGVPSAVSSEDPLPVPSNEGNADGALADDPELPLGVEPWTGDEMPAGRASSHDLLTPRAEPFAAELDPFAPDPAPSAPPAGTRYPSSPPPDEEPLIETAADELNYRHLYETRYRNLEAGARENAARHASGSDLFALCLDPSPHVVAALLENSEFGLAHARALAQHHQTDRGIEILARRAQLLRDSHVQRRLMQNMQTPDVVLERVLRFKRLLDIYRLSVDRDLPERNRVRVRTRLRPFFTRAEPEDRAALVIKTEGRCLNNLAGCTFDSRTTQILCNLSTYSTLFIQNLARFSATPPMLIAKLLKSPSVQRQPQLRAMLVRHPNAGSEAKRRG